MHLEESRSITSTAAAILLVFTAAIAAGILASHLTNTKPQNPNLRTLMIEAIEQKEGWIKIIVRNIGSTTIHPGEWGVYLINPYTKTVVYHSISKDNSILKPGDVIEFKVHETDLVGTGLSGANKISFKITSPGDAQDIVIRTISLDPSAKHLLPLLNLKRVLVDENRDGIIDKSYYRIQDAVNNSPENSLIIAGPGIYDEKIEITKPVTIQSGPNGGVVLRGEIHIGNLKGDYDTIIKGITIEGNSTSFVDVYNNNHNYHGGIFFLNTTIIAESVLNGDQAIRLKNMGSKPIVFQDNLINASGLKSNRIYSKVVIGYTRVIFNHTIFKSKESIPVIAIELDSAENSILVDNEFVQIYRGVALEFAKNVSITNNFFDNDKGYWIYVDQSSAVNITNNKFNDSGWIDISSSRNIMVSNNTVHYRQYGFVPTISIISSNNVEVHSNTICCSKNGVALRPGFSNYNIHIYNNIFQNLTWWAFLFSVNENTENITFTNNTMINLSLDSRMTYISCDIDDITHLPTYNINYNIFNDTIGGRVFLLIYDDKNLTDYNHMLNATFNTFVYNDTLENIQDKIRDKCYNNLLYGYVNATPAYQTSQSC